jgi:molybdopterin/thiamine biosynthesis adenylyltransferase
VSQLNDQSINDIIHEHEELAPYIAPLFFALIEWCILEDMHSSNFIEINPRYRSLNFLSDYIPSYELTHVVNNIANSTVIIVGVGGIGSWLALGLAQLGVKTLILIDNDIVNEHNLNRSLFFHSDIGKLKTSAIKEKIREMDDCISVTGINRRIESSATFMEILNEFNDVNLVINAADYPNVDTTSRWIFKPCMDKLIPHIVAGGYNLHLSLIGPTIIPNISACFECINIGLKQQQLDDFSTMRKLHRNNRNIGNISPLAGISASITINEALRILCKTNRISPVMLNKRGEFNFLTSQLHFSEYPRQKHCTWCNS